MRRSYLAALQVYSPLARGAFETEPFEAAWAAEAIAFLFVDEAHADARLDLRVQISVDGTRWIDFEQAFPTVTGPGSHFLQLRHFGTWLRLAGEVTGGPEDGSPSFIVHIYLDLKE